MLLGLGNWQRRQPIRAEKRTIKKIELEGM
jgi:hypothetical protein